MSTFHPCLFLPLLIEHFFFYIKYVCNLGIMGSFRDNSKESEELGSRVRGSNEEVFVVSLGSDSIESGSFLLTVSFAKEGFTDLSTFLDSFLKQIVDNISRGVGHNANTATGFSNRLVGALSRTSIVREENDESLAEDAPWKR